MSVAKVTIRLFYQFELNLGITRNPGHGLWLRRCFVFVILNNGLGILPYVFTASSHLVFAIGLALTSWFSYYIVRLVFSFTKFIRHLVPLGTPVLLLPLIVLIELVRGLIRPLTLRVRLVANIIAGHLLLTLLSSPIQNLRLLIVLVALSFLVILLLLESAVAVIQGYVFSLLSSLYLAERNRRKFNYLNNFKVKVNFNFLKIKWFTFSIMEV